MPETTIKLDVTDPIHPCVRFSSRKGPPAISLAVMDHLTAAIKQVRSMPGVRTLTITGGQKIFAAGGDLKEFMGLDTPKKGRAMAEKMHSVIAALEGLPFPVIAAISGDAFGGGLELAVGCDIRIAAEHASMGFTQARFGLIPGWGGASRMAALIGPGRAFYLMSTARVLTAQEAMAMGIVQLVVKSDDFNEAIADYRKSVQRLSPDAVAAAKRVILHGLRQGWHGNMGYELDEFEALWASPQHLEGLRAFFAKEKPNWADK